MPKMPSGEEQRKYASPGTEQKQFRFELIVCRSFVVDHSPYGTQIFFTWVACSRNQRPSANFGFNQSIARPSFVQTCFRLPTDMALAAAALASSPKHQTASTSSCSASVFRSCDAYPVTIFSAPPGKSLVSKSWYRSLVIRG